MNSVWLTSGLLQEACCLHRITEHQKTKELNRQRNKSKTSLDASVLCLKDHNFLYVPTNQEVILFQDGEPNPKAYQRHMGRMEYPNYLNLQSQPPNVSHFLCTSKETHIQKGTTLSHLVSLSSCRLGSQLRRGTNLW